MYKQRWIERHVAGLHIPAATNSSCECQIMDRLIALDWHGLHACAMAVVQPALCI